MGLRALLKGPTAVATPTFWLPVILAALLQAAPTSFITITFSALFRPDSPSGKSVFSSFRLESVQ